VKSLEEQEQNEFILITDARMLYMPEFHSYLQSIREELSFVVTVNRNGEIRFLECIKGNLRVLSTAKMDLEEALYTSPVSMPSRRNYIDHEKPAFFSYDPPPLLFPKSGKMEMSGRFIAMDELGVIVVTKSQRVLLIRDKDHGAIELLNCIEKGTYVFGWNDADDCYILVRNLQKPLEKLYKIVLSTGEISSFEFTLKIPIVRHAFFNFAFLYLRTDLALYEFDCTKFTLSKGLPLRNLDQEFKGSMTRMAELLSIPTLNKFLGVSWLPYNIMYKIKSIGVTDDQKLQLGNYTLTLYGPNMDIKLMENTSKKTITRTFKDLKPVKLVNNKQIKSTSYTWRDGSELIADSRGMLHLRSSDKTVPEFTIVAVTQANTACWASDGKVTGSGYFLHQRELEWIPTTDFYKQYIKRFIDKLV
jgi:hypothetical protein